ncbi:hypothetical protein ACFX2C_036492 [Malus domestica]
MGKQNSSLVSDAVEATAFVDTSLGTHIAVTIDPNATVSALKRKIEHEHLLCFNSVGRIKVKALKDLRGKDCPILMIQGHCYLRGANVQRRKLLLLTRMVQLISLEKLQSNWI